ncbi:SLBB domain-containing protein [Candidatus Sumerlaeota bacterium]|nr:SLBB domain-containing protein [Candidatus Sumerlaeota bacterium]
MTPEELHDLCTQEQEAAEQYPHHLYVCSSDPKSILAKDLRQEIKKRDKEKTICVHEVGFMGLGAEEPIVRVEPQQVYYQRVGAEDIDALFDSLDSGKSIERLACETLPELLKHQRLVVLDKNDRINPNRIEDYIACGGYQALMRALTEQSPAQVLEEITQSGLRGRGGAGFPTGLKWNLVAKAQGEKKYVVCNADEGDPGAFMDRMILECNPHRVLEGMLLAGYAVGASQGYIYIRAEYPLAIKRLRLAIKQAQRLGLLGHRIGEVGFDFNIELRLGAGAFVCGEETALLGSIAGRRGTPRPRPPYPAERGLWNAPTLINNVETFANIAPIMKHGSAWFANIGTEKSKGTKVFALAGRVTYTGLVEVPMGVPLRDIIFKLGGGIPNHCEFKAVQTGGPSGGCIPAEHLDISVDYDSLAQVGSIMGSGGMIIMDETSCMVDVAKFFMAFCCEESCGKCIPCRVGTSQMYHILQRITNGQGTLYDLELLEELCDVMQNTSLCGLGQTAPNPLLSTLRFFRHEYLAHILDKQCPAKVCKIHKVMEAVS